MPYCNSCGTSQNDGAAFCTSCGSAIGVTASTAMAQAPGQLQQPPPLDPSHIAMASHFAVGAAAAALHQRIAANACPRCGTGMAVVIKRSKMGLVLVIVGLVTTPAFGIGLPIFIVGYIMRWGGKGRAAYQCPGCNYAA